MKSIIVHGHRGSRGTSTENTIPSFQDAQDARAEFVELDVHLTKDQHLIVYHDFTISDRLCKDAKGNPVATPILVSSLTLEQIKSYSCGSENSKIPTLEELIFWKQKHASAMKLNVEIKNDLTHDPSGEHAKALAKSTLDLLTKHGLKSESLVQSFDMRVVKALRAIDPSVKLSCLFEEVTDYVNTAIECKAQVVALHYPMITGEVVQACTAQNLEVLPWTVNDEKEWTRLIDLGVRAIITDFPLKLKAFVAKA